GIKFDRIPTASWNDSIKLSKNKDVDILSGITESNREHLIFTKPYIENDIVIIMNDKHVYVESLEEIKNQKIALVKDYGYTDKIIKAYPEIKFILVDNINDGISGISTGRLNALLCTFALGSYNTTKNSLSNVKVVGKTKFTTTLGLGVRKDYIPLVGILNKAIDAIGEQEHVDILNNWIKQDYIEVVDYSLLWKVGSSLLIILLAIMFWNRKMVKEIAKRKEIENRLSTLFEASPDSIAIMNKNGSYVDCNIPTLKMFGVESKDDFIGTRSEDYSPLMQERGELSLDVIQMSIKNVFDYGTQTFEWIHMRKDSQKIFNAEVVLSPIILNKEPYLYAVVRDITSRKELENKIKENQKQMVFVSENANLGFWTINPQVDEFLVNDVFVEMLGYDVNEVLMPGYEDKIFKPLKGGFEWFKQLVHSDDVERSNRVRTAYINGEIQKYELTYRLRKSDGSWMWSSTVGSIQEYDKDGKPTKFNGVNLDIQDSMEAKEEIQRSKLFLDAVLDSQEQIVITTDGIQLVTGNKTFYDFYNVKTVDEFIKNYGRSICETFDKNAKVGFLQSRMDNDEIWIDYIIDNPDKIHKAVIIENNIKNIFTVTAAKIPSAESLKSAVFTNITALEEIREEVESINKHTQDSIDYASLIQHALLPDKLLFDEYFSDHLTIWQPKDTVGGDVYLFEELRIKDECLLMVVDCTGHGVPGAFVTMLVKAIERQVVVKINNDKDIDVSPAWILSYFNKTMKKLLQQESKDSVSNAGFDGGVLYYNKKDKIIKFSGAETQLFYIEENELKTIKGSRQSVGYKKSDINFEFQEHVIHIKEGMQFYLPTDGYLDQNGGEKGFPFGKKMFSALIQENQSKSLTEQKKILLDTIERYQGNEDRNDDLTLVGFKI
uniref:PAS domain S-box protein n=1 Tax=Sulfurimonas sp. TaxID=2022749 RepID=UPI0025EA6644